MSDASDLATYIQTFPTMTRRLIIISNYDDSTATTVDSTALEAFCTEALHYFALYLGPYDATNYPTHKTIAKKILEAMMMADTDSRDVSESIKKAIEPFMEAFKRGRTLYPVTNAVRTPTTDDSTKAPEMGKHGSWLDGYRAKD